MWLQNIFQDEKHLKWFNFPQKPMLFRICMESNKNESIKMLLSKVLGYCKASHQKNIEITKKTISDAVIYSPE